MSFLVGLGAFSGAGSGAGIGAGSGVGSCSGSVVGSHSGSSVGSCSGSGVGSRSDIRILSFYWKNFAFKVVKNFSLAPRINSKLFKRDIFPTGFTPLSIPFNSLAKIFLKDSF